MIHPFASSSHVEFSCDSPSPAFLLIDLFFFLHVSSVHHVSDDHRLTILFSPPFFCLDHRIPQTSLNNEAAELLEILTRFELEGVCFAFDQILRSGKISTLNIHPASSSTSASNITSSSQAQKSHAPPVPSLTPTLSSTSTSHAHPFTSSHGPSQATTQVTSSSSSMPLSSSSTATPSTMIPSTVYDHPLSGKFYDK